MFLGERQDRLLDIPPEQVIRRLERVDRANLLERGHLAGVVVRHADVANLANADELVERLRRLGDRCGRIGPVDLVEVDVVGAERAQARLEVAAQGPPGCCRGRASRPRCGVRPSSR